jgi:pyruvate, water dikinase
VFQYDCNILPQLKGMARVHNFLKRLFFKELEAKQDASNVEELRALFKARYHNFKLLLNANNKALDIMADMERALAGGTSFGMSFIRANCTAVSVNVFQIIKILNELSSGKYQALFERYRHLQDSINQLILQRKVPREKGLVLSFDEIDQNLADCVGIKMANLGEVRNRIRLQVPDGFVITAQACKRFFEYNDLQPEIDRLIQASDIAHMDDLFRLSSKVQQLIIRSPVPEDLERAIYESYHRLVQEVGEEIRVSVRSSALGEDSAGTSFAGQYRSELNVSADDIIPAYKEIVASKYSLQAVYYRLNRGIRDEDISMCVGCMIMVQAIAGGVLYSRNPLNIRDDTIQISSVWGLPKSVVDGSVVPDMFKVARGSPMTIVAKDISAKERKLVCYPDEGVCRLDLTGELSEAPSLTDKQVFDLAEIAIKLENHYGSPQDIEWAIAEDGTLYILQCRPLQQMRPGEMTLKETLKATAAGKIIIHGGITAGPGVAYGPVFVVEKDKDALQVPKGAILVVHQPLPRWAALLNRVAAVVAEEGGLAGHLANVAREFGVPAIFGVASAAAILKNQDLVTVDADGLTIYQGRVEELLLGSGKKKNLMEGSPVYETLKGVINYIIPLTLIDPDSLAFKPEECKTFHDITRFCHEKSVQEMFNFGKEHHFSERSSKQLFYKVPMQWWVINLDDGFKGDIKGKYVRLEDITSVPMLALWEGMIAVPWQGPPPLHAKGFMSVLAEATANPALNLTTRSRYAERNYFMISRNFCSLSSRFGFHFSTTEALVGERAVENYISYQFKGGAADYQRRLARAVFVGDILEDFGFRIQVKEDAVFARVEQREENFVKERLKIIGYMNIHTRQLDMIMSSRAAIEHYRAKILKDIDTILQPTH